MDKRQLGRGDLRVSEICLGTMTWGRQNSEQEAHAQLDLALDRGVNFIDTAEVYPVPMCEERAGLTERFIGSWLARRGSRDRIILATKVAGPGLASYLRAPRTCPDRANIIEAVEGSLRRLGTDYVDLYQVHWPDRATNFFGRLGYLHDAGADGVALEETLEALDTLVRAGKVREVGLSNETPWGVMRYLGLSERRGWARPASIQNPYNLLNRSFEIGLAEVSHREQIGLLAYSPLGFGALTGKYLRGERPAGARLSLFPQYGRYEGVQADAATAAYVRLARDRGLSPAQMALSFVTSRPFVTSNIIGATSQVQLEENLASVDLKLDGDVIADLDAIHRRHPNPSP